ncbi:MAG: guanylate kinase [Planctomycetota bacterium]|nr:guanylate kinase [Planctomycetaceae bacterium]MDQ3329704.1 guanylate kinase [Planctomycetota bacterium]
MTGGQTVGSAEPRIVVISGPSGTGKTTVVRRLIETAPVAIVKAVTATTRAPRPGEADGRDYHFLSPDDFFRSQTEGRFLETAEVFGTGTWYGTPRSEVERAQRLQAWSLLEIDVRGALKVKRQFEDTVMIFLRAASAEDYERRLRQRATETDEAIRSRLDRMREELRYADRYEFQVINDDVERAVAEIGGILRQREAERNA